MDPSIHQQQQSGNIFDILIFQSSLERVQRGLRVFSALVPTDMTADTALSLDGTGRLDYSLKTGPKRDVLLRQALQGGPSNSNPTGPSSLEVKFRTRSKSGTLLHVQESSNYTTVKVREHESRARVCVSKTKV